jgi:hypothetical protein
MKIPEGWKVTLYDGENFNGANAVYKSDAPDLGNLDNAVSSLRVEYEGN